MKTDTTAIQLPPPRRQSGGGGSAGLWLVWVGVALIAGIAGGIFAGIYFSGKREAEAKANAAAAAKEAPQVSVDERVAEALQSVEEAVSRGKWLRVREGYENVLALDPENERALAALPLVELYLSETKSGLIVDTNPTGATIKLGNREATSKAHFTQIPLGEYTLKVTKDGFEPFQTKVRIEDRNIVEHGPIDLVKSSGSLTISSQPLGVEYQLIKADESLPDPDDLEIVAIGQTPAMIEKLDPGEYRVQLALKNWPDYSETVSVEHNRKTSVSHIFAKGGLKITSDPDGAEVFLATDRSLELESKGRTPVHLDSLPVGNHQLELRHGSWPAIKRVVEVKENEDATLTFSWPRAAISFVSDPAGAVIELNDDRVGNGKQVTPFTEEIPEGEYTFVARSEGLAPVIRDVEVVADEPKPVEFNFDYGKIIIETEPPGAAVIRDGVPLGRTPYRVDHVRPGTYSYQVSKPQHRTRTVSGEVASGLTLRFDFPLEFDPTPKSRSDFVNGFGMKMIWIDELKGWVGEKEVTQKVFEKVMNKNPSEFKGDDLPVHGVSWYDAEKFGNSLTTGERGRKLVPKGYAYQLPTDRQWSVFVGEAALADAITGKSGSPASPSAVGASLPNEYGLYDVRGNVWEWCSDWYNRTILNQAQVAGAVVRSDWVGTERKVLRGGSWNREFDSDLEVNYRHAYRPGDERREVGIRIVLMPD